MTNAPTDQASMLDRGRLADLVAQSISMLILDEGFELGALMPPITKLSSELNVSRTVAREAVAQLENQGVLKRAGTRRWVVSRVPDVDAERPFGQALELTHRSLSDQVADAILDMILAEDMRKDDSLPSARELSERFDVSIVVIREALSALAARGVLSRRQGREPGIALPDYHLLGSLLHARSHLEGISTLEFQNCREVLEVEAARLAAFSKNPHKRSVLEPHLDAMYEAEIDDEPGRLEHDLLFHLELARLSGNRAIALVLNSLHDLIRRQMRIANAEVRQRAGERGVKLSLDTHRRVFEAVVDGDVDDAVAAVHDHFALMDHL